MHAFVESEVTQSCPTLSDPMDCSPPGSSDMEFSRQEYWSGLPFPSPGDTPDPGIELRCLMSRALASRFFPTTATRGDHTCIHVVILISPLLTPYFNKLRVHTDTFNSSSVPKDSTQPSPFLLSKFFL